MSATFSPFFEVARTRPTSSTSRAHSIDKDSAPRCHPEARSRREAAAGDAADSVGRRRRSIVGRPTEPSGGQRALREMTGCSDNGLHPEVRRWRCTSSPASPPPAPSS